MMRNEGKITMHNLQRINEQKDQARRLDIIFWIIVVFLLIAAIIMNHYFVGVALALRLVGWIVLFGIEIYIVLRTSQGVKLWKFIKDARIELLKVVWPTRQETVQVTIVVVALVIAMALILWGVDSILLWALSKLTG
jgi:preprotein translocase subunit SecE